MTSWLDILVVLLLLTDLGLLGSSRLGATIRTVAAQGMILGLLPLLAHGSPPLRVAILAAAFSAAVICYNLTVKHIEGSSGVGWFEAACSDQSGPGKMNCARKKKMIGD